MVHLNFVGGSLHNHIKQLELTQKFELKKQEGTLISGLEELSERQKEIKELERQAADIRKSNKIAAIDSKLKAGGVPTEDELKYLRANNHELYSKAVEVIEERRAYKKSLQRANTKDEVSRINSLKLQQFSTELKAVDGDMEKTEQIGRRFMGVMAEHTSFISSKRFDELPTDDEYYEGKRKPTSAIADKDNLPNIIFTEISRILNEGAEIHAVEITV